MSCSISWRQGRIKFTGNKAITNAAALRRLIPMKDGEIFNIELVRKGLKNLRDAYGSLGYINFTPVPDTQFDDEKKLISLTIDLDEGKPFSVRRIEFKGNTTTRDKVIRRELAVEEGQVYNGKLSAPWHEEAIIGGFLYHLHSVIYEGLDLIQRLSC